MFKYLLVPLMLLTFGLAPASFAADGELTGKVVAIDGNVVKLDVTGEMPSWAKKGGYLRTTTTDGKLIFRGAKISSVEGNVITVNTPRAKEKTVGGIYKLARGKASAGC